MYKYKNKLTVKKGMKRYVAYGIAQLLYNLGLVVLPPVIGIFTSTPSPGAWGSAMLVYGNLSLLGLLCCCLMAFFKHVSIRKNATLRKVSSHGVSATTPLINSEVNGSGYFFIDQGAEQEEENETGEEYDEAYYEEKSHYYTGNFPTYHADASVDTSIDIVNDGSRRSF